jgi:hypothetical protein
VGQATYSVEINRTLSKQDLKVCDDGILVKILCFWTLSIVLYLSKNIPEETKTFIDFVEFEEVTVVTANNATLWNVTTCSLVETYYFLE